MNEHKTIAEIIKEMSNDTLAVFLHGWQKEDDKSIEQIKEILSDTNYNGKEIRI